MDDRATIHRYVERYQCLLRIESDPAKRQRIADLLHETETEEAYVLSMQNRSAPNAIMRRTPIRVAWPTCKNRRDWQAASRNERKERNGKDEQGTSALSVSTVIVGAASPKLGWKIFRILRSKARLWRSSHTGWLRHS